MDTFVLGSISPNSSIYRQFYQNELCELAIIGLLREFEERRIVEYIPDDVEIVVYSVNHNIRLYRDGLAGLMFSC